MPVGLLRVCRLDQVEAILLHELAHIRRYDYLVKPAAIGRGGVSVLPPGGVVDSGLIRAERGELL